MIDFILDTSIILDCERLRDYFIDIYGYDLPSEYLIPGYIWIYFVVFYQDYSGNQYEDKYLYIMYELQNEIDKDSYVVFRNESQPGNPMYYIDIYRNTGDLIESNINIINIIDDTASVSNFDYMICGCLKDALVCGKCCIYCCKIAEATKEYYEKILE